MENTGFFDRIFFTRSERKLEIVRVLLYDWAAKTEINSDFVEGRVFYTVRQIAKMLDLKPTAYLRSMLSELCIEKVLTLGLGKNAAGTTRHEFTLNQQNARWTEPYRTMFDDLEKWRINE